MIILLIYLIPNFLPMQIRRILLGVGKIKINFMMVGESCYTKNLPSKIV